MVTHLAYREEHYPDAQSCTAHIRQGPELEWVLAQVRGPAIGPFAVLYYVGAGDNS